VRKKKRKKNQLGIEIQPLLKTLVGVDLCRVDGISEISCLELISETGTDLTKWATSKNFSAWLNVAPNTKITGGKIISSKMQKKKNFAGQTIRMSASCLSRSNSPLGDFSRKMKSRLGKKGGVVATANKLSTIIHSMVIHQTEYNPGIMKQSTDQYKEKRKKSLEKQLAQLKKAS
jgi:hypothetical protein